MSTGWTERLLTPTGGASPTGLATTNQQLPLWRRAKVHVANDLDARLVKIAVIQYYLGGGKLWVTTNKRLLAGGSASRQNGWG